MENKIVLVSGGFDPVHIGHVRMFQESKKLGDTLVVLLNNDNWLMKKKGFVFMPVEERYSIILEFESVDLVMPSFHLEDTNDMSICEELKLIKPDIFANGGDRFSENIPEFNVCKELGIEMVFNVGGEKVQSSSDLVKKYKGV